MAMNGNKNSDKNSDKFECNTCNYITKVKQNYIRHTLTRRHLSAMNGNKNSDKILDTFECKKCNYITGDKSDYIKHLLTRKHKNSDKNDENTQIYICQNCTKQYKTYSGLWRHKKICISTISLVSQENSIVPSESELIKMVMEENAKLCSEMQAQNAKHHAEMQALIPHVGNNNNNNSHNKKFNINIFLNETCKDAINMKDFIKNIQITLKDVMHAAENGVLSSSRNLVLKGLQDMEITTRPIHCTDVKRNTMYIKDKGAWNKDNDNEELKKTMQCVSTKHVKAIKEWEAVHPNYMASDKGQQEYIRIVQKITQSVVQSKRDMQSTIKNVAEETHLNT